MVCFVTAEKLAVSKARKSSFGENMKPFVIALLVVSLLAGCAAKPKYEQTSMKLNDGTTHYFIKTHFKPCQLSKDWATRTLTIRANEICKSGYTLVDAQTPVVLEPLGASSAKRELLWEIKCSSGQPKY
jgi:uncharacterized lipoprotein